MRIIEFHPDGFLRRPRVWQAVRLLKGVGGVWPVARPQLRSLDQRSKFRRNYQILE